jgi:hypothetical protein
MLEVRDGAVVSGTGEDGQPLSAERLAEYVPVEGMFDFIEDAIDRDAYSVDVNYDAALGFPAHAAVDYIFGMADEERALQVHALTPVE